MKFHRRIDKPWSGNPIVLGTGEIYFLTDWKNISITQRNSRILTKSKAIENNGYH